MNGPLMMDGPLQRLGSGWAAAGLGSRQLGLLPWHLDGCLVKAQWHLDSLPAHPSSHLTLSPAPPACSALPLPHGTASFLTPHVSSPMQQCLVVSAWLELAVGAAVPLCILLWLEARTWPHFEARQQQQRGQQRAEQPPAAEPAAEESETKQLPGLSGAVVFYLFCSLVWCVLCSVYG